MNIKTVFVLLTPPTCTFTVVTMNCRVREMCQSCQTWPAKLGQNLLRTDTRLVFCNRKLMRTDIFFTRTTKPICNFTNSGIGYWNSTCQLLVHVTTNITLSPPLCTHLQEKECLILSANLISIQGFCVFCTCISKWSDDHQWFPFDKYTYSNLLL